MRNEAFSRLIFALFLGWIPVMGVADAQSSPPNTPSSMDPRLRQGLAELSAGECQQAHQTLQGLIDSTPTMSSSALMPALIGNGKSLSKLQQHEAALQQYERALEVAPADFDREPLRLVAADAAYRCGQTEKSLRLSTQVLESTNAPRQKLLALRIQIASHIAAQQLENAWASLAAAEDRLAPQLIDLATKLGAAALTNKQPSLAEQIYNWLSERADSEKSRRQAELGIAWAAALGAQPPDIAAAKLRSFADRHPNDPDAIRALRAEAACWRQAGRADKVYETLRAVVAATSRSAETASGPIAIAAIDELAAHELSGNELPEHELPENQLTANEGDEAVRTVRRQIIIDGGLGGTDAGTHLLAAGIVDAACIADEAYWKTATAQAISHPYGSSVIASALTGLSAAGQDASAERLAAVVLSQIETPPSSDASASNFADICDQVCRWAAESGRWTMLALSAENVDADQAASWLAPTSTRLLGEALIQSKRSQAAKRWFDAAVAAGAEDFITLVRRAELSVALDDLAAAAEKLQSAADAVQQPDGPDGTLIEVLRAELAIRRARLEEARTILQRVVRLDTTESPVRCRAQWLIGETYLLQKRPAEAVDAYRMIESFDTPAGNWTAVALVQAGKAFEQLGRPRDAATCYGGLLQRFADSEHALVARDRLAVIRNDTKLR